MNHPSPQTPGGPSSEAVVLSALAVLLASVCFAAFLSGPTPASDQDWDSGWDAGWAVWASTPFEERGNSKYPFETCSFILNIFNHQHNKNLYTTSPPFDFAFSAP
ncbi:hypothetical protein N431DRAFT_510011 [Stipitochalara longipes BDJ]|nr:hypothetical protein N431DRAFT_510011 [Stipitochalara longipes BDJ]